MARLTSPTFAELEHEKLRRERTRSIWKRAGLTELHMQHASTILRQSPDDSGWWRSLAHFEHMLGDGFLVLLHGDRGRGKTQLAACLCWLAAKQFIECRYLTALDFFLAMRAHFGSNDSERDYLRGFYDGRDVPGLLVIDEVHERGGSEWEDRMLTHLIDKRYALRLDTILITNENPKSAAKSLGASIMDRLRETGGLIECNWPSYRTWKQC